MAVTYLELSKLNPVGVAVDVAPGNTLLFDTIVASDGLGVQLDYEMGTGMITFLEAGFYYIDWCVATQGGFTTDGSNWAIQTTISGVDYIGSSHSKVSVTTGFALINAAAGETARLVNVSNGALVLSQAVQSKADLIVFSIATMAFS